MAENQYNFPTVALPFGNDIASYFKPKKDIDVLKSSLMCIILTATGERVMEPNYGTQLPRMPFEPIESIGVDETLRNELALAIQTYDPRLELQQVKVDVNNDNNSMFIHIIAQDKQDPDKKSFDVGFAIGKGIKG